MKPRILYVSHRFLCDSQGGTEVLTHDVAKMFVNSFDVTWLSAKSENKKIKRFGEAQPIHSKIKLWEIIPVFDKKYPVNWKKQETLITDQIQNLIENHPLPPPDIVHFFHFSRIGLDFLELEYFRKSKLFFTLTDYTMICPDYQLFRAKSKKICHTHRVPKDCLDCLNIRSGENDIVSWKKRNLSVINERFHSVFTQTPKQAEILIKAGLSNNLIKEDLAHYDIPVSWKKIKMIQSSLPFHFGYFGRISPEKGIDFLLSCIPSVHHQTGAIFDIYGLYDNKDVWAMNIIEKLKKTKGVVIHNPVFYDEVGIHINKIHCLLIPSIWLENHPTVLNYAVFLKKKVLVSEVDSLSHLKHCKLIEFITPLSLSNWTKTMIQTANNSLDYGNATHNYHKFKEDFNCFIQKTKQLYMSSINGE